MKITAGLYKDKKINTFSNLNIRPTSSKVRQALFNILINRYSWNKWCHKANLLDAFSGSGIISIEALSRKINSATLIEENKSVFKVLENNLRNFELVKKVELINKNFFDVILKKKAYDIVYIDPPYYLGYIDIAIQKILNSGALKKGALIICEAEKSYKYNDDLKNYILSSKNYGKTSITFFNFL
jgi:16S rRNA (guanine966-N2)-methyltransferase